MQLSLLHCQEIMQLLSDEAEATFIILKTTVTTAPVLVLPDFSRSFEREYDASGNGISVALMQNGYPIAFAESIVKEMLAIVEVVP